MVTRHGEKWTREETILAYDLYCRTPFAKISMRNQDIVELARILGRSSGSVGLKMANLAHYDPVLIARNVSGMSNASKLDKEVVDEFNNDWEELSYQAQLILEKYKNKEGKPENAVLATKEIPEGRDKVSEAKRRIGQNFFRMAVLSAYDNLCCITGIGNQELLVASHIKPWKYSDSKTERTNPRNGLCLNALHDKAFDRGLITLSHDYKIVVSKELSECVMDNETYSWFHSYEGKQIILPNKFLPDKNFIEYHNDVVFRG